MQWNRHSEICRERCGTRTWMRWSLMNPSGAWELFHCILACLTSMSRTLSPLIFEGILQYVHLAQLNQPRNHRKPCPQVDHKSESVNMVNLVHLKRNRRRYFHVGTDDATIASMYETKSPPHGRERVNSRQLSGSRGKMHAK